MWLDGNQLKELGQLGLSKQLPKFCRPAVPQNGVKHASSAVPICKHLYDVLKTSDARRFTLLVVFSTKADYWRFLALGCHRESELEVRYALSINRTFLSAFP